MPRTDSIKSYYCPSCGVQAVSPKGKGWRSPICSKCGLLLHKGGPSKQRKLGIILAAAIGSLLGIVAFLAYRASRVLAE